MKILWFTWKDRSHPQAGGAEVVNEELAKRLVKDGHEVILLVGGFKGANQTEIRDGFKVIRLGNRYSVYYQAKKYYKKNLVGWADLVIDEINTVPFFCKFYVKEKNILFIHQLCRQIWFYEMIFPISLFGYLVEPLYLRLLRDRKVITVSKSSKDDLLKLGFKEKNISIISEGIEIEPVDDLRVINKYEVPTILSLGSIRAMKRTDQIIKAFLIAKEKLPRLRLIIAGGAEGKYGAKVLKIIRESKYKDSIEFLGKVSQEKKIELLRKSQLLAVTSVKEGWCLAVSEANSQGTPAVVYNVDGLRDSVRQEETGIICKKNTPENLADNILDLLGNEEKYQSLRLNAWESSKQINFERSYEEFRESIS